MQMREYMNSRSITPGTNIHGKKVKTMTGGIAAIRLGPELNGSMRLDADAMAGYTHSVIV